MKLGSMQPYFFPYIGYFDLINYTDNWIVFDSAQYTRHGWINRNRIHHPNSGWQYLIVPLKKHGRDIPINKVIIDNTKDWKNKILGQLQHNKKKAPFFKSTMDFVEECFSVEENSISKLNIYSLERICNILDIDFNYSLFSQTNLGLGPIEEPDDWALRMAEALGAAEYANPSGGRSFFKEKKFMEMGIKLTFRQIPPLKYICEGYEFIPDLSIIDVLMWNSPEKIKQYLDDHTASEE